MLVFDVGRYLDDLAEQVADDFPQFAHVSAHGYQEVAVVGEDEVGDPFSVLMLHVHVVEKLCFVQLDNVEDLLGLFELFTDLEVLHAVRPGQSSLSLCDECLEDSHALFPLAHGYQEVPVNSLTLAWHSEHELAHL